MTAETHTIQGRRVEMPVEVRSATVASAMFPVPAATAQTVIAHSGLEVFRPLPGRAICSLAFIDYVDGDLDAYHEFAVAFLVRVPGRPSVGAFIHWLPVDQGFTLEAGRSIWGFPKEIADLPIRRSGRVSDCAVRLDGRPVVELALTPGVRLPAPPGPLRLDAFAHLDGVTRHIPWIMRPRGVRARPGGAAVRLGDHPVAEELRRLDLPGARALSTATVDRVAMTFGPATAI